MKLKKSHLTGQTAIQVSNTITQEFKRIVPGFISDLIGPIISPEKISANIHINNINKYRLLYPVIVSQTALKRFVNTGRLMWCADWWVSEVTATHKDDKVEDFMLIFDDSVRLDAIAEYMGNSVCRTHPDVYHYRIKVIVTILHEQIFLDSLGIQPVNEAPRYVDILGNEVHVGDVVVISGGTGARLYVDKVKKLTPRSIVLEGGTNIPYRADYDNRLVVVSDLPYNKSKL